VATTTALEAAERGIADRLQRMHALLRPRSVAVVGASPNPSFVSAALRNLGRFGYTGQVVAVNPKYDRIADVPCYATLADVPHAIDLAVIGVSARFVPSVLEDCERKGVGAVEIITSGFAETGPEGVERQQHLTEWARHTGVVVGGPNCLGLMHAPTGMVALPTAFERVTPGSVGVILQSGMMAPTVLAPLFARGIGITFGVTSGNEADLELADYIQYYVEDDETRVIGCFAEQIKTPSRFIEACELAAEREKPIVMLKIGRSDAAAGAALAHTGSLAGSDAAVDALMRKLGVSRVNSVDEMLEQLAIFHAPRRSRGSGVAAVIVSGGAAGLLSDLATDCEIDFVELPEPTLAALQDVVPEFGNVGNPLDLTGQAVFQTEILSRSLDLLAESPNVDVVIYGRSFPGALDRQAVVGRILEDAATRQGQIVFLAMALVGGHFFKQPSPDIPIAEPMDRLAGIPFLQGSEYGLRAVRALIDYGDFLRHRDAGQTARRDVAQTDRRDVAENARRSSPEPSVPLSFSAEAVTEREAKLVLARYGIGVTREHLATSVESALAAAEEIGWPVALKVESPDLLHKTEAGAIALNVADSAALRNAYDLVLKRARDTAPAASVRGVLVQEMVSGGTELILGMKRDPHFGPVIAVGLGGIFVEVFEDIQFLLPPVSEAEARAALQRLRGFKVLQGARGRAPADIDALVDSLIRFSELCLDLRDSVDEIDINPLIVLPQGVRAVDALIVPRRAESTR